MHAFRSNVSSYLWMIVHDQRNSASRGYAMQRRGYRQNFRGRLNLGAQLNDIHPTVDHCSDHFFRLRAIDVAQIENAVELATS